MTAVTDRVDSSVAATRNPLAYVPGLDGIRAIAVTGVLLFHADLAWIPGGFLGVDVFFVLSGYLITTLLLKQLERSNGIAFKAFYLGRARRLLPALFVVLLGSVLLALTIAPDAAARLQGDILASLTYTNNWWYIGHGLNYFEAIGRPPLLQHLWTLSIEEQFYVVWPVVALLLFRWGGRLRVGTVALAGSLLATGWMAYLSVSSGAPAVGDVSRFYFGTDSHSMGILLGAAFATFWRMGQLPPQIGATPRRVLTTIGIFGLVGLGLSFAFFQNYTVWLYRGGFLVVSVLTVMVIAAAVHPGLAFGRILGWGPLRYLGTRSYGLYLYHWPIFMVLRPGLDVGWTGLPVLFLRLGLTVIVAELSYRFVEMPIRHGALGKWWIGLRAWSRPAAWAAVVTVATGVAMGTVMISTSLAAVPSTQAQDNLTVAGVGDGSLTKDPNFKNPTSSPTKPATTGPTGKPSTAPSSGPTTAPPTSADLTSEPITAVGDSVMLGDRTLLEAVFPNVLVDAAVGRQSGSVFSRIEQRLQAGKLAPVVVIHTGTNGTVVASDLDKILTRIGPNRVVVLVTTHVPRPWQNSNNAIIQAAAARFHNVRLVDWNAISAGHREYFVEDGVHMNKVGGRAYTTAIALALGGNPKTTAIRIAAGIKQLNS